MLLNTDLLILDIKKPGRMSSSKEGKKFNQLWQGINQLKETILIQNGELKKTILIQNGKPDKLTNITQNLENKLNGIQKKMVEYENKLNQLEEKKRTTTR